MQPFHRFSLAGALGLTMLLAPMVLGNLHPWGTHDGLAGVQWPVFCTPRWLCLALALGAGLRAGRFYWISAMAGMRFLVVAGAHFGMGLASLFCLVAMSENHPPVPLWLHVLAVLVSLVVPTVVMAFLAAPGQASEAGQRLSPTWGTLLAACVLLDGATGATVGWREHLGTLEVRREEAARDAQRDAQQQVVLAQMDRLPPDAPLERWLPYTAMAGMPTVITRAEDTIRARPHLTFDLVGCLRHADAPTRALALSFVRGGGLPPVPAESIPAAREALSAEVASMRARVETQPDLTAVAFDPECLQAVFLVARYPGHEAAFVEPLREMRAVLNQLPRAEPAPAGQEELDVWLRDQEASRDH